MTDTELKEKIRFAVSSLTGKTDISQSYGKGIMTVFGLFDDDGAYEQKTCDEVVESTLKSAPMIYSGVKAIPELSFWKNLKRSKQRDYNTKYNVRTNEYVKPNDAQVSKNAEQARSITEKFAAMDKGGSNEEDKPNLYTEKVKRYRQYIIDKLVRVDDDTSVLHNQWILKAQALNMCVKYHCPVEFLQERGINV